MIANILQSAALTRMVGPKLVATSARTTMGPALATFVTRYYANNRCYSTHKANGYPFTHDHAFDVNEMAKKTADAVEKKKHTATGPHEKIDTELFKVINPFDENERAIKAARLAELAEQVHPHDRPSTKEQPPVHSKGKNKMIKKAVPPHEFHTSDVTAKHTFDVNESYETAARLEDQAKPFQPAAKPFLKEEYMTENAFDANETLEKASRLAEEAAAKKKQATRAT